MAGGGTGDVSCNGTLGLPPKGEETPSVGRENQAVDTNQLPGRGARQAEAM